MLRNTLFVIGFVIVTVFGKMTFADQGGPEMNIPEFQSYGSTSFGATGNGWWNLDQYESRVFVNIGANSTERIISMQSGITIDKYDPSVFMFNVSIRMLDETPPTGRLNFRRYSWCGNNSLFAQVQDTLHDVYVGWDEATQAPVFRQEMWADLRADLYADAVINEISDGYGRWTEESYDSDGNLYFSQSGGMYNVYGYGNLIGDDPASVGRMMVESGMATYGTVPEPTTMALIAIGGITAIMRRRRQRS